MPLTGNSQSRGWPLLAGLLILSAALLRLAYLVFDCPLDLAPDEAHYWDWSRHLDWSYYSKGPLVAWLIRASTSVFGNTMPAVRLPAVVCGSLLLLSLYALVVQIYGSQRLGVAVVALALTLPPIAAGATLMTIDAPFTCCWGWALVLGWQAAVQQRRWAWPACGFVVGLGILAKYTMLLWLLSFALFLVTSPARRRLLVRPGFWVLVAVAAVCCTPILIWNVQHEWIGLRHVLGQTGLQNTHSIRWAGPAAYLAVQFGLLLGFWFFAWAAALIAHRPGQECRDGPSYLWWMSVPMFLFFLLFSFKTAGEPNWPLAGYLSGFVLAVAWIGGQLRNPERIHRRLTAVALAAACTLGLALTAFAYHSECLRPLLVRIAGPASAENPVPLRRLDPTCRLRGWRFLAAEIDRLRLELHNRGEESVVVGTGWALPGELAFYCEGHPEVFSVGVALGDRHSQYDLWRPNPVADAAQFKRRAMIVVGGVPAGLDHAFEHLESVQSLVFYEDGCALAQWTVAVARGFRGVKAAQTRY